MKTSKLIATMCMAMSLNGLYGQNQPVHPAKPYRIVIEKMDSTVEKGMLEAIRDSSIIITVKIHNQSSSDEIYYSDINTIKLRRTGRIGRGALIGFGSGAVIGGVMGAAFYKKPDVQQNPLAALFVTPLDDYFSKSAAIVEGIFIGGITGGVIGGAIGSANVIYFINGNYKFFLKEKREMVYQVEQK